MEDFYLEKELYERMKNEPGICEFIQGVATDGIWYRDLENPENEWMSDNFKLLFGYQPEEIPNTSKWWQKNIYPEDMDKVLENFEKHKKDPSHPFDQVVRYFHKDGSIIWVRCRGKVLFNEKGEPSRMIGSHTDLTELKVLEERYSTATHTSRVGVWDWFIERNELIWDEAMYDLYGITRDQFAGAYEAWQQGVHPQDQKRSSDQVQAAIEGKSDFNTEFRVVWPSGEIRFIRAIGKVYKNRNGEPNRMLGINWDITDEVNLRNKVYQQNWELMIKNKEIEEFAYFTSHDLQAPVRHISSHINILKESLYDNLEEEDKESFDFIISGATRIQKMIEGILKISKVGKDGINRGEVFSKDLVDQVENILQPILEESGASIHSEGHCELFCDEVLMLQVFQNLIENGIKYRKDEVNPEIKISFEDKQDEVVCSISDNGTGIDNSKLSYIFLPFKRLTDDSSGSGIGLSVCHKILKLHEAELKVESEQGIGSTFSFSLKK